MRLKSTTCKTITQELATKFSSMETIAEDRPLSARRQAMLAADIERGLTLPFVWAYARLKNGRTLRVNGKHSSSLLCSMSPFPRGLTATIQEYECDNEADAAVLYAQFDCGINARSQRDVNHAVRASSPLESVSKTVFDVCASGIAQALRGNANNQDRLMSPEEKASLVVDNEEFARFIAVLITPERESRWLCRAPIVAAVYLTWKKCDADCRKFWLNVRDGVDEVRNPTRVLQKYLLQIKQRTVATKYKGSGTEGAQVIIIRCLRAWNAWRRTETTDLKIYSNKRPELA